jgi:hypothetical protein
MSVVLGALLARTGGAYPVGPDAQRLIVDTDMGFDVDDAVAVCLANSLHMNGKINLLAVVHNTGCKLGIGGVSAINHFYGHDNITLGAWKGKFGSDCDTHFKGTSGQNQYLGAIIKDMRGPVQDYDGVPHGTEAYRTVLANAPNNSVNVASIGMPTNLRDLLATKPDAHSTMTGYELVQAKVNTVVFMDGGYNFGCAAGLIGGADDCYGSAEAALRMPPNVRLMASGEGANPPIYTGSQLQTKHPLNSPCRKALRQWCCNPNGKSGGDEGRLSWDPITVMIAGLGVGSVNETEIDHGAQWTADADGRERFFGSGTKNAKTTFATPAAPAEIRRTIDSYVDQVPGGQPTPTPQPPSPPQPAPPQPPLPKPAGMCPVPAEASGGAGPAMGGFGGGNFSMAWDGDVGTFYDYSKADGGWTEAKLSAGAATVAHIEFYPRADFLTRDIKGGKFVGLTVAVDSKSKVVTLGEIDAMPTLGWNVVAMKVTEEEVEDVMSVKYQGADGSYGNIAEIRLYKRC